MTPFKDLPPTQRDQFLTHVRNHDGCASAAYKDGRLVGCIELVERDELTGCFATRLAQPFDNAGDFVAWAGGL